MFKNKFNLLINFKVRFTGFLNSLKILIEVGAEKISTTELVNKIFTFCELYSGVTFYPYQEQFSKRIIRSVLENDGAEITALFSRQSGINLPT